MQLNPLHDRVVLRRTQPETVSAGGIVIPDTATEKPDQGEVIAVGPGRTTEDGKLIPLTVKISDKVLFGKFAGHTVKINGEEVVVVREEEIYGIIEN